ncbi:hypothetical protein BJ508DRAFT_16120 [Ascobolus immersus RN42]|uniref:Uncharacterized protein n=1 Tax=Ascobolus immersus RN42 TaxID=1160509 RepID=A0A3N4HR18_ASCIM|nr:hypothetical protein BJ508DRAFT_16120 [Ascobolus immersus RN42]
MVQELQGDIRMSRARIFTCLKRWPGDEDRAEWGVSSVFWMCCHCQQVSSARGCSNWYGCFTTQLIGRLLTARILFRLYFTMNTTQTTAMNLTGKPEQALRWFGYRCKEISAGLRQGFGLVLFCCFSLLALPALQLSAHATYERICDIAILIIYG